MTTATATLPSIEDLTESLTNSRQYFERSTSALLEQHSSFAPKDGLMTAAGQVMHIALTVDWFLEGAFGDGFDMDFEEHMRRSHACTSLAAAREALARSFDRALDKIASTSAEGWAEPLAAGPVMGGQGRYKVIQGIVEHTAHHRGALTIYARLLDLEPPMPYM